MKAKIILILIGVALAFAVSDSLYGYYQCERNNNLWYTGKSAGSRMTHSDANLRTMKAYILGYCVENPKK